MDSLIWNIKSFFRKYLPLMIVAAIAYGGYTQYQKGTFRRGLVPGVNKILAQMPVFGSHFKRGSRSSYRSHRKSRHHRRGRHHRRYR